MNLRSLLLHVCKQVSSHIRTMYAQLHQKESQQTSMQPNLGPMATPSRGSGPVRRNVITRVFEAVRAIALCHNVTPVYEDSDVGSDQTEADQQIQQTVVYQASSPDEVILYIQTLKSQNSSKLLNSEEFQVSWWISVTYI